VSSKSLFQFLKEKNLSLFKPIIERYPCLFIRGFADAEGCAYIDSHKKYRYVGIKLYNGNLELLEFIKDLLLKLGIDSTLQTMHLKPPRKVYYSININRRESVRRFADKIGFTIQRKSNKLGLVSQNDLKPFNRNF
jgi:intein-encoded DNA endonuclease-like protein